MKKTITRWIPPALLDLYRGRCRDGYIWEGVYQKVQDVPRVGSGYDGEGLVNETAGYTKAHRDALKRPSFLPSQPTGEHSLLAFLASVTARQQKTVRILDFGGGMGIAYLHLRKCLADDIQLDYHIVETAEMCRRGGDMFPDDSRVHFHTSLPDSLGDIDILYVCSALQYVEDYRKTLEQFCTGHPRYILLSKLSAVESPTYATAQKNLAGASVPYWFINIHEIVEILTSRGYTLLFKDLLERLYDQDNFEPRYRMGRACNLLWARV
jgi:putative methyltransferase (TIGR04325 family)